MVYICTKFGIANYDEYSLVYDLDADDVNTNIKTATLRRVISKKKKIIFQKIFLGSIIATNG
jgi:hypothetical protein